MEYIPTIGLEVHAELKTRTKMFCDSPNDADEKHPNTNVCPVCLGHPGTLPVINKSAVEHVIKVGLALGGKIADISKFDRKNYFYPDLPKAYQISQYDQPLVQGGELLGVRLIRVHLEEDTGTLVHETRDQEPETSLVDFNRAGVPLMELVTEPDIKSAGQAVAFGKELRLILRYLGVSDADMEKGHMRLEANVSLSDQRPETRDKLGTKVEVKNINSFKALGSAIEYEIKRQSELLEKGEKIKQETRGWDDIKQKTFSQRTKEEAHDYRYFPEPDLPPLEPTKVFDIEDMKRHLSELPAQKRERFQKEFALSEKQAAALIDEKNLVDFFEAAASELASEENKNAPEKSAEELLFNYLTSDLVGLMNETETDFTELKITPQQFASLINLISGAKIMSRQAKEILRKMFETGEHPEEILAKEGLETVSDEGAVRIMILEVIKENPQAVADFKKGKSASLQFLVGKSMAKLRGRGNPEMIRKILEEELSSP